MFEIIMLAGFLVAGISQLIPTSKSHSKPDAGAASTRSSSNQTQAGPTRYTRQSWSENQVRGYRQIKAA